MSPPDSDTQSIGSTTKHMRVVPCGVSESLVGLGGIRDAQQLQKLLDKWQQGICK